MSNNRTPFCCYISNQGDAFILDEKDYDVNVRPNTDILTFYLHPSDMTKLLFSKGSQNPEGPSTNNIYDSFLDYFTDGSPDNIFGDSHQGSSNLNVLIQKITVIFSKLYGYDVHKLNRSKIIQDMQPGKSIYRHIFSKSRTCKPISNEIYCHFIEPNKINNSNTYNLNTICSDSLSINVSFKHQKINKNHSLEIQFLCNG